MKVAVIGCTHAGTAAVKELTSQHEQLDITVYERNDNVSFLSCGIALHVGGVVEHAESLFYSSPDELAELGANMRLKHDVLEIDSTNQTIVAKNLVTGETVYDTYDKLIMTTGSWPIIPMLPGIELNQIELCKNYHHAQTIIKKATDAKRITVVGAGYIGAELVEAFEAYGKEVTFIDSADRILNKYLDRSFTDIIENELTDRGIRLELNQTVQSFTGVDGNVTQVVTDKGTFETDLVILCVGFRPSTELLKGQIDMLPNGAIIVDDFMRTSNPNIFAAGDSCAVYYNPARTHAYIPLATNAVRMGTLVGKNLLAPTIRYQGTQGTSGLRLYDLNIASTGLTEDAAPFFGLEVTSTTVQDAYRPEFMPTAENVQLKLVYETTTHRLVGAQIISKVDLTQAMNTLSVAIQNDMTLEELAFVDFFFQPHYNKPWNLLNQAALQGMNELTSERV
ncbi:FAD-dependent pyridine nucleotide-disulphide oxidoreductase [Exiguobacterium sibiricum 255-15]|uniref:FAD-dependent pyridine nucleotide-disulphide oxidoreductase n=1 Tax=Exiguobacterium sibiricum (strain DSM 17290 / CCUG 55495 / CIP 109462 / JCM 13490 / 255-15) TaxID=262543 RepID=B1YF61_EXIS2|nr:FAD-dependent oxidoreductase [Exiguobacterium sibiricum]ACB62285.1 FAD-dependent pyridine nucleotide-disulphide oxidoreductase [Exiguobacterium sibiricum 255-15]